MVAAVVIGIVVPAVLPVVAPVIVLAPVAPGGGVVGAVAVVVAARARLERVFVAVVGGGVVVVVESVAPVPALPVVLRRHGRVVAAAVGCTGSVVRRLGLRVGAGGLVRAAGRNVLHRRARAAVVELRERRPGEPCAGEQRRRNDQVGLLHEGGPPCLRLLGWARKLDPH